MTNDSMTEKLIAIVDEAYAYQAGPIGMMICEEALENWRARDEQLHYMQLPQYIDELLKELPDRKQQVAFVNQLKEDRDIQAATTVRSYLEHF